MPYGIMKLGLKWSIEEYNASGYFLRVVCVFNIDPGTSADQIQKIHDEAMIMRTALNLEMPK